MGRSLVARVVEPCIGIRECSGIFLQETVETRVELDIAQIKRNGARPTVVKDRPIGENRVPNAKVENRRVAAVVAALECRQIGYAVLVDEDLRDGVVDANAVKVPLA